MPHVYRQNYVAAGLPMRRTVVRFTEAELSALDRAAIIASRARDRLRQGRLGLDPEDAPLDVILAGIEQGAAEALEHGRLEHEAQIGGGE
jgi:hypothetical protein